MSAAASVIIPLAVVALTLPYHGGLWLLLALAGGAAASVILVELGERRDAALAEHETAEVVQLPTSTTP